MKSRLFLISYEKKKQRKKYFSLIKSLYLLNYKQIYKNERAGILLSTIPFLALIYLGILSSMELRMYLQNKTATLYRLEFCSRSIVEHRRNLLRNIQKTNKIMRPLRYSLYAMRGAKGIPGAQLGAAITEKVLLSSLRLLSRYQNSLIKLSNVKELKLYYCKKDTYSKTLSFCRFSHINSKKFIRKKTLFRDTPGSLQMKNKKKILLESRCFSRNKRKILSRTMFLKGDPYLRKNKFEVFYGKAPSTRK